MVLVYRAEKLNAASANAMLKVIEEPPENVLFVFTAVSEAAVLPTIRSRCSVYTLAPLAVPECAAALERLGAKPQQARRLAEIFDGRLGEAKACLADERSERWPGPSGLCWPVKKKDAYAALCLLAQDEKDRAGAKRAALPCALCVRRRTGKSGPAARFPAQGPHARRARASHAPVRRKRQPEIAVTQLGAGSLPAEGNRKANGRAAVLERNVHDK